MNAIFGNLTTDGLEEAEDRLGGFQPLDTDIYSADIKAMYAGQSAGGAQNVTVIADVNGREYRETIYITNKKGENFFLNKNDKTKKVPLPGFTTVNDICLVATGQPLSEQATEDKVVNVYDKDAGREIPKSVPMLVNCLGKNVSLAIVRQVENKSVKQGDEYVPTADTREINFIDKVFDTESHMTVVEAVNEADEAAFWDSWIDRNRGKTRDKVEAVADGAKSGRPGGAPQAGAPAKGKSLFKQAA